MPPKAPSYGNTVGPLLREANGESHLWKWWDVLVNTSTTSNSSFATIKNAFPSGKGKPNCLGYYMTDYYHYRNKEACRELPWAERVHLHKESRPWQMIPVPGTDCFNIIDNSKPNNCLRYLSASTSCRQRYVRLAAGDDGSGLQRWRMVSYAGGSPSPSPSKPPSSAMSPPSRSPPVPVVKGVAPVVLTIGASSTSTGTIVFLPTPGATSCTVSLSKSGSSLITSTITSLSYPQTSFYPVNLSPNSSYGVDLKCTLPDGKVLGAPTTKPLHTPINNGQPTVINFVPTSGTSGNMTVVPPDPLFCTATSYILKALPTNGAGKIITVNSKSTTISITGLSSGVTYALAVQAVCTNGQTTAPRDPIYLTPPKATT